MGIFSLLLSDSCFLGNPPLYITVGALWLSHNQILAEFLIFSIQLTAWGAPWGLWGIHSQVPSKPHLRLSAPRNTPRPPQHCSRQQQPMMAVDLGNGRDRLYWKTNPKS